MHMRGAPRSGTDKEVCLETRRKCAGMRGLGYVNKIYSLVST